MIIALDATPLIGARTGIGRYVAELVSALSLIEDLHPVLVPFTMRGRAEVPPLASATVRSRPVPARVLRRCWLRSSFPPVELLAGACDVFHGTNFVLPPRRRVGGVVTVHDLTYLRFPQAVTSDVRQFVHLVPKALREGAVVVSPTRAVAEELIDEYGLPAERVLVTHLGVSPDWFQTTPMPPALRNELRLPTEYILFVGTREPRKNLTTLMAAHATARTLDASVPPLVLVGPSGWGPGVEPAPNVRLLPHLPERALRQLVAGASTLAMPSLYEGFGLPVLEALAAGRPVLASDVPALREVAGDQATFVAPTDVEAWADALLNYASISAGDEASRRARAATFTWSGCADATVRAYRLASSA